MSAIDIHGGNTVEEAGKDFLNILKGNGTFAQNAVVLANSAMALQCIGKYKSYEECYQMAVESLESGKAFEAFQKLIA